MLQGSITVIAGSLGWLLFRVRSHHTISEETRGATATEESPMGINLSKPFSESQALDGLDKRLVYYPLVNIQKAIENGHRNSGFTH